MTGAAAAARARKLRARLLLLCSAASFGLMAVLARRLSHGDAAFSGHFFGQPPVLNGWS